jgi:hypothetical protein
LQLPNLSQKIKKYKKKKFPIFFLYGVEKKGGGGNFIRSLAKLNDPVKERKNPTCAHTQTRTKEFPVWPFQKAPLATIDEYVA